MAGRRWCGWGKASSMIPMTLGSEKNHKLVCHKTRWLLLLAMTSLQGQGVNMRDGESQLWLLWQLIGRVFGNSNAVATHLLEKA